MEEVKLLSLVTILLLEVKLYCSSNLYNIKQLHMARTWLINNRFPAFRPHFQFRTKRENQIHTLNQSQRTHIYYSTYSFPMTTIRAYLSLPFPPPPCLWLSCCQNTNDGGWLPCYSKLWINSLCLFSFVLSLFLHHNFFIKSNLLLFHYHFWVNFFKLFFVCVISVIYIISFVHNYL